MDLKSMLNTSNDASTVKQPLQPPRLHTPQSSFDRSAERATPYDVYPDRPPSYPPSSLSRSQTGGCFASPSPAQNSASTPSAASQSIYGQSPGPHGHLYTPRDSAHPQTSYPPQLFPSPGGPPTTPGTTPYYQAQNQQSVYGNSYPPTAAVPRPPTRDDLNHANGLTHAAPRQMSPPAFTHQTPVTPLGPPAVYHRPSPQAQRPLSQGYDHYRRSSVTSIGSSHSRDYTAHPMSQPEPSRAGSVQRAYLGDEERQRERERSLESVSPKTIPRPTPQRQSASYSQEPVIDTQPPGPPSQTLPNSVYPHAANDKSMEGVSNTAAIPSSRLGENYAHSTSSSGPSPSHAVTNVTPQSSHSSLPAQPSPSVNKQSGLKRSNSILSTPPASAMPPRKRPRRDEIPVFAQSARRGKPIRFDTHGPTPRPQRNSPAPKPQRNSPAPKREAEKAHVTNGQGSTFGLYEAYAPLAAGKEPSITNEIPHEDLVRQICDWIANHLAGKTPPTKDSQFEVEAKLGAIVDQGTDDRVALPVLTEAIIDKSMLGPIRFASTMDERTHQKLNQFLNTVYQQSLDEFRTSKPDREVLRHKHLKESDEFYELTLEGRNALPQSLAHWLKASRHAPKVRKTIDQTTGALGKQIIKLRIADLEVYNPRSHFDYRVSLSLEVPWDGEPDHLVPPRDNDRDRKKDRISYRHMTNQVDLTQITYYGSSKKEHELEVEISPGSIETELALLVDRQENNYEALVSSFINNVRLLCREAGMGR